MTTPTHFLTTGARRAHLLTPTPGEHMWTALALYRVNTADLTGSKPDGTGPVPAPMLLDHENLATVEIGCFVCEQPYSQQLATTRCPGEPR